MRRFLSLALAGSVMAAGCAAAPQYPLKRPMSAENAARAGATEAEMIENNDGVGKTWFYRSSSGAAAAYGLAGVLASAIVDAVINAGPDARAKRVAGELSAVVSADELNSSLLAELREEARAEGSAPGVHLTAVNPELLAFSDGLTRAREGSPGRLVVRATYRLSVDASTLEVVATATYADPATPWQSPYAAANGTREASGGPAYRNTFTYASESIPLPVLNDDFKTKLVAAVEAAARDSNGNLPAAGTREHRVYTSELARARDDEFSADEMALFLTVEWTKDNGRLLRTHIAQAHDFIARYVVRDLNDPAVPSMEGVDQRVETMPDGRTVRMIGTGVAAGSYVSSPSTVVGYVNYGNTYSSAPVSAERQQRLERLKQERRANQRRPN